MQKIIYKYELNPYHALTELSIPIGAKVLCVQTDGKTDNPCVWALVDKDEEYLEERVFGIIPTGVPFNGERTEYIGTFQMGGGHFVGHVFEKVNKY